MRPAGITLSVSARWCAGSWFPFRDGAEFRRQAIIEAAQQAPTRTVVTACAPMGPVASVLAGVRARLDEAGIALYQVRRSYDDLAWPYATKGVFALKRNIPLTLARPGLAA